MPGSIEAQFRIVEQPDSEAGLAECPLMPGSAVHGTYNQRRNRCDQLERRRAPEGEVGGAVDDAHVAAADLLPMR